MFTHIVLFWLKDGAPRSARESLIVDCDELLRKIPSVRYLCAGEPAMTPREVVDNSYDVGLCVVYHDQVGHEEYQAHPLHREFLARNRQWFDRVKVYDFM